MIWMANMPPVIAVSGIYGGLLLAGAAFVLAVFWCVKNAATWLRIPEEASAVPESRVSSVYTEWMAVSPIASVFILLACTFLFIKPLNPDPGMATIVCLGAIALTMARRMKYSVMIAATLFMAAFAQSFWAFRPDLSETVLLHALFWSGGLFAAALAVPFTVYRCFTTFRVAWMAWPLYEVMQAVFFLTAADKFWAVVSLAGFRCCWRQSNCL
jgi:hypothetical protein